jgi:hypothetical protein
MNFKNSTVGGSVGVDHPFMSLTARQAAALVLSPSNYNAQAICLALNYTAKFSRPHPVSHMGWCGCSVIDLVTAAAAEVLKR